MYKNKENQAEQFTVGVGKVEVTPPLNIPYLGCIPRHSFFKGIHDSLYARSLYVSDGKHETIIISTDTIGFSNALLGGERNYTEEIRKEVDSATGIPWKNVMVTSSHIHSTPDTLNFRPLKTHSGAEAWLENLKKQISSSAMLAKGSNFKACMKMGKGKVENISRNRRNEDCIDEEMVVFFFESAQGKKIFLVHFACHPIIMQVQNLVSADFVGVLQTKIEQTIEKTKGCLFLQGACGDINPRKNDTRDFNDAYSSGMALAGEVMKVFGQKHLDNSVPQPVILKTVSRKVAFPSRLLPNKQEICEIKKKANEGDWAAEEALWRIKEGNKPFHGEIQAIRIGNSVLVGIPGEPFCQLGMEIKKMSKVLLVVPVGYSNGYLGYITPPHVWKKGGYEVTCGPWSKIGPEGYEIVLNTVKRVLLKIL